MARDRVVSRLSWLAICAALGIAGSGLAQRPLAQTEGPWRYVRAPNLVRAEMHLERGRLLMRDYYGALERNSPRAVATLEGAIARFARARALAPDFLEASDALADALCGYRVVDSLGRVQRRARACIALSEALREAHPDHEVASVAFHLAIAHQHLGEDARAIREYETAARTAVMGSLRCTALSNLAEIRMRQGDLEGAIHDYQRAVVSEGDQSPRSLALSYWGLAVAWDRQGELQRSKDALTWALTHSPTSRFAPYFSELRSEGVEYEPASEIYYYEYVGHRVLFEQGELEHRALAIAALERFLQLAAPDEIYLEVARARLAALSRSPTPQPSEP